jgi:hypothetical protein
MPRPVIAAAVRPRIAAARHNGLQPPFGRPGPRPEDRHDRPKGMTKVLAENLAAYLLGLPLHRPHRDKLGKVLTAFGRADHPPDPVGPRCLQGHHHQVTQRDRVYEVPDLPRVVRDRARQGVRVSRSHHSRQFSPTHLQRRLGQL